MKLSVSLSGDDVTTSDDYARARGLRSRSAAVQRAIAVLRQLALEEDYAAAWAQWAGSGEQADWESAAGHGIGDAPR